MTTISENAKVYDAQGVLTASGVTVVIDGDIVAIGAASYPIDDVTIDRNARTITSENGWSVDWKNPEINEDSEAYNTGFEASKQGEGRDANPYPAGTWDAKNWYAGWDAE